MLRAEQLWEAWKSNFTRWLDDHYKLSWEMSPGEWTHGVIDPYLLYLVREKLNLWVRFEPDKKKGAVIFDADASMELAHLVHENERDNVSSSMQELYDSEPNLKCIVTYGDPKSGEPDANRQENDDLLTTWNEKVMKPVLLKLLARKPEQVWLIILGLEYDFRSAADWTAYQYSIEGGRISILQLD